MPKIKIKNLNTEINRRIKLIKTATSVVDIGQQQGAVVNQTDYVGICLAPLEVPVISCDGAIPTCELKDDSDGMHFMSINEIVLNGLSYTRPDNDWGTDFIFPPNTIELVRNRRQHWEDDGFSWDYYIQVNNLSDTFMRIEFLGYFDTEGGTGNANPTLGFVEGPKAIVCLSP
ncbi:hypothetical protein SB581_07625 [Acinetobacter baumannii]|nr:hypothetical protein SB581_07625 [Acinetobacter baumannii]